MRVIATYSGTCPECGRGWQPGDPIRPRAFRVPGDFISGSPPSSTEPSSRESGFWRHYVCPDPLKANHPVCPMCYLTHPVGSCDW